MEDRSLATKVEEEGLTTTQKHGLDIKNGTNTKANVTRCLSEHERSILQEQIEVREVKSSYATLYRYATGVDRAIMAISALWVSSIFSKINFSD
jgi:hypothetical protein